MERATFMTNWHDKKLKGLVIGATGAAGNAAARLEPFMTKAGMYAYGSLPEIDDLFQRQAKELDRKQARGDAAPDPEDRRRPGAWWRRSSSRDSSGASARA